MMNLRKALLLAGILLFLWSGSQVAAQGILLRGMGAVNESMGGAAVAAPLDATGAIYWNPASISFLKKNEISFGLGLVIPKSSVSSQIHVTGTGQQVQSGYSDSDAGQVPVPTMSFVWRKAPDSRVTLAIGLAGIGGAASLYEANPENPILEGHSKSASVQVMQVTPTFSYQWTDRLSIGFAPIVGLATLSLNPMNLGRPTNSPLYNYGTRYAWGAGFQAGLFYDFQNHFKAGVTYKSKIWTEDLEFSGTTTSSGITAPATASFAMDLPMTVSLGTSYDGIEKTILALDLRYMDYHNTEGFKETFVVENGVPVIRGLGWDNVWVLAFGIQREMGEHLKLRGGYTYNTSPIPAEHQMYAVAAPLVMQHSMTLGATYTLPGDIDLSCAWARAFEGSETGYFPTGNAALTGAVTNAASAHSVVMGIAKRF